MRYLKGHPHPRDVYERFWEKVDQSGGPDACWPWTRDRNHRGYGRYQLKVGRTVAAHRFAWEATHGPIPEGIKVCHTCDNPPCCNPAHLFHSSQRDNAADMVQKGRSLQGTRHPNARFTDAGIRDIRNRLAAGTATPKQLVEEYHTTKETISSIRHRKSWKHVE